MAMDHVCGWRSRLNKCDGASDLPGINPISANLKTYARTRGVQTLIIDLISGGKLRNTVRRLLRDLKTTVRPDTTTRNKFRVYAIEVPLRGTSKRPADLQSPFTFRDFAWNVKGRIKPER